MPKPRPATSTYSDRMQFSWFSRLEDIVEHPREGRRDGQQQREAVLVVVGKYDHISSSAATSAICCVTIAPFVDISADLNAPAMAAVTGSYDTDMPFSELKLTLELLKPPSSSLTSSSPSSYCRCSSTPPSVPYPIHMTDSQSTP
uniref:Uncharacterized protein n=1 Tax=Oryza brachyantha TaxID=4533 RepID=J3MLR0_ORYBR